MFTIVLILYWFYLIYLHTNHSKTYPQHFSLIPERTRTPAFWGYPRYPMITHSIDSYWIPRQTKTKSKLQIFKNLPKLQFLKYYNELCTWHTFWSCLIRCVNMKWIQLVLKIQSGHYSVHRWTDRRTRWNQYTPLSTLLKQGVYIRSNKHVEDFRV